MCAILCQESDRSCYALHPIAVHVMSHRLRGTLTCLICLDLGLHGTAGSTYLIPALTPLL